MATKGKNLKGNKVRDHLRLVLVSAFLAVPMTVYGALDDVVWLSGTTKSGDTMVSSYWGPGQQVMTQNEACEVGLEFLGSIISLAEPAVQQIVGPTDGIPIGDCGDKEFSGDFWLIFSSCSMVMSTGTQWMRWTVPPHSAEASMIALDMSSGEAYEVPLETTLEQLGDHSAGTGKLTGYNVTGPGGNRTVSLKVPQPTEFEATLYNYEYRGEINPFEGLSGTMPQFPAEALMFMPKISVHAEGHAYVVPDAPGADVIAAFYANFRDHVKPPAGMGSLMAGMVQYMSDIATRGIPVETTHKSSVGGGSMVSGFGQSSESTTKITAISVLPGLAPGQCALTVIPDGFEVINVNDMIAESMKGMDGK